MREAFNWSYQGVEESIPWSRTTAETRCAWLAAADVAMVGATCGTCAGRGYLLDYEEVGSASLARPAQACPACHPATPTEEQPSCVNCDAVSSPSWHTICDGCFTYRINAPTAEQLKRCEDAVAGAVMEAYNWEIVDMKKVRAIIAAYEAALKDGAK